MSLKEQLEEFWRSPRVYNTLHRTIWHDTYHGPSPSAGERLKFPTIKKIGKVKLRKALTY